MKKVFLLATVFVLSSLLISAPTSAAPDGSLRKMLDTKITLIEYITLQTDLRSLRRVAKGVVSEWGEYSSVVEIYVDFDYDDSELSFVLRPVDGHYFSTIAKAKSYCRDLIREERFSLWLHLLTHSTPNGWSKSSLQAEDFEKQLYKSTKIETAVDRVYIEEELPEGESLRCKASLDDKGEIKNFSYNL